MIALFESGSTGLHFSWWDGTEIKEVVRKNYPDSFDSLRSIILNLLGETKYHSATIPDRAAACSVSSKWRESLFETVNDIVSGRLVVARTASDLGINVSYDKPETYGIDRALAAYGAFQIFQNSCVVVDAGTAVTIDAVALDGTITGGYIFPGSDMLAAALSSKTDLPKVSLGEAPVLRSPPEQKLRRTKDEGEGIGNSTVTGIRLGISMGFSAAVNHLIKSAMKISESDNRVVITGGGAENLIQCLTFSAYHKPHIVLEALGLVADMLPKYT